MCRKKKNSPSSSKVMWNVKNRDFRNVTWEYVKNEIFNTGILEFSFEQNSQMEQQKTQREKQMMKLDLLQRSQSCHRDLLSSQLTRYLAVGPFLTTPGVSAKTMSTWQVDILNRWKVFRDLWIVTFVTRLCLKKVSEVFILASTSMPKISLERLSKDLILAFTTKTKIQMERLSQSLIDSYIRRKHLPSAHARRCQ